MERKLKFSEGEFYHLYNRGVNKAKTFFDKHDYYRFMFLLYLCNSETPVHVENILQNKRGLPLLKIQELIFAEERGRQLVDVGAFCLMPNHFHFLVRERIEGGITQMMLKLGTAYAMYVNRRHTRTGPLFTGPFKAEHVDDDVHLKYLFAYIHLNPVKLVDPKWKENGIADRTQAEKFLRGYEYSSYRDYAEGAEHRSKILNASAFPNYFVTNTQFKNSIKDWLDYRTEA